MVLDQIVAQDNLLSSFDRSSPKHCITALRSEALMYSRLCLSKTCARKRVECDIFLVRFYQNNRSLTNQNECYCIIHRVCTMIGNNFTLSFSLLHMQSCAPNLCTLTQLTFRLQRTLSYEYIVNKKKRSDSCSVSSS